jgi:Spy/CpxP family protein refolding chaperone
MKNISLLAAVISFSVFVLFACSHQTPLERDVAAEVAQEQPLPAGEPMAKAGREILFEAPNLSPQQKQRLKDLHVKASQESERIRNELSKNQLVLLKGLVNPKTKDEEIDVLKDRIVKLEKQRTSHFLATLDSAKRILGRKNSDDERFYRAFLFEPLKPDTMP